VRVLVSSTEGAGHFGPLVPVVEAAARRGDDVLFVVPPGLTARVEATGHPFRVGAGPPAEEMAAIWDRVRQSPRGEASVLVNREFFGRLATAAMLPAVGAACDEWRPDLILREAAEYASAVAAERRGLPHAQVAIGLAEVESSSLALAAPVLEDYGGQIVERLLASPYLTRLPASLDPSPFTATRRFRESAGTRRSPLPDWWDGDESPLVFVSFGTIAGRLPAGVPAYQAVITAVTGLPVRVLLTTGRTREAAELGPLPRNVHVEAWVPQQDVLPHASLAVIHGGSGTTFGALAAGLPLVFVPMMADQPANARLVAGAGAGIVVEPDFRPAPAGKAGESTGSRIRAAIETILADASYREAAQRIAAEMRAAPAIDQVLGTLAASLR
jgi:UDP:flavonoid glycosyltransferase YjiC (YdhE family)